MIKEEITLHGKESYQRMILVITAFSEDDVIVSSGNTDPGNGGDGGLPILTGTPDRSSSGTPGTWY